MWGMPFTNKTKAEEKREAYEALCTSIKSSAEMYQTSARVAPHRERGRRLSPGLAAVARDVANAMQTLSQRAADMKRDDKK